MPFSSCQPNSVSPGPVPPQTDLHVALRVDRALLDESVHRRPVRDLDAEDLRARVRVRVEMDEADRPVLGRTGADVGLCDRVITAEHDRDRTGREHLAHGGLDCSMRARGVGGEHRRVAEVDHAQHLERVDLHLEMRAVRTARRADPTRAEPRSRPVRDEIVRRRADDRHVDALELRRILGVGKPAEGEQAGIVGLRAMLAPALEGIDHALILPPAWARPDLLMNAKASRPLVAIAAETRNASP